MPILPPPPRRAISHPRIAMITAGRRLFRIFDSAGRTPIGNQFKFYGPRGRFDHHRGLGLALGHTPQKVAEAGDPDRGILYAAETLETCLFEVFQDDLVIKGGSLALADLTTGRELTVLDFRGTGVSAGTHQNGVPSTIDSDGDRCCTQAWARYLYDSSAIYTLVDGFAWTSRFVKQDAFVFFERANGALTLGTSQLLTDPDLRSTLDFLTTNTDLVYDTPFL